MKSERQQICPGKIRRLEFIFQHSYIPKRSDTILLVSVDRKNIILLPGTNRSDSLKDQPEREQTNHVVVFVVIYD